MELVWKGLKMLPEAAALESLKLCLMGESGKCSEGQKAYRNSADKGQAARKRTALDVGL